MPLSPSLSFPACSVRAARRTPPVDFVHRAPTAKWTRGNLSTPPGPPLGALPRPHASQAAPRAATTPPAMRRAAAAPPARRRLAQGQIDRPQSLHSSPRSSLAYKDPQNPTVAPLLPLLPPPAAPPWPPRSSSRGPASPAPHCPLRPPQQLRHLPVTLHARGIEPKPPPDAVPLLRRRRRAQAHHGPAGSEEDRARQLPQKLPRAHAVLVRALFPYPEPSFTSSAGEPNNRPAIDADDLEPMHQTLERRPG